MISAKDYQYLVKAVDLAELAVEKGDQAFGSILVSEAGVILFEGHNEVSSGDHTRHPEFAIARWAANHLSENDRLKATVYTSGEHCPMCAAAHGWVGLGRIVFASSSTQLQAWSKEFGWKESPVKVLPIEEVINNCIVEGPVDDLAERVKGLHQKVFN